MPISKADIKDHGLLIGLGDAEDHPWSATTSSLNTLSSSVASHIDDTTIHFTSASIVHNDMSGLAIGDSHTQYIHVSGTRAFAGGISHGGFNISNVGAISASQITGSHREVTPGIPFLVGAGLVGVSYASNGQVTISGSGPDTSSGSPSIVSYKNSGPQSITTSSTFVPMIGMFITASAGTYMLFFRCTARGNSNVMDAAVYKNGTEISNSYRTTMVAGGGPAADMTYDLGTQVLVTAATSGTIFEIYWRKETGPNDVRTYQRNLTLLRIAP